MDVLRTTLSIWTAKLLELADKCYPRHELGSAQLVELEIGSSLELVINSRTDTVMSFWSSYISQNEIETAALDLIERHGEGAHEEAIRLADVARRIGSTRNSAIFRRAARYLASEHMTAATRLPMNAGRMGKIVEVVVQFGRPRVPVEPKARG
jgi:hypothetical protein